MKNPVRNFANKSAIALRCAFFAFAAFALAPYPVTHAQTERFDNFQMRKAVPTTFRQVAPDLYFLYDDISSNSAVLVTDEGVLVVDTRQHPAHGRDLIERIRQITDKPIKWAINTHAHGDHFYGNPAFKAIGTTIIAHRDVVAGMIKNEKLEFKRRQRFFKSLQLDPAEVKTVLPDVTFDSRMTIRLGGRTVEIMYLGRDRIRATRWCIFPTRGRFTSADRLPARTGPICPSRLRSTAGSRCLKKSRRWTSIFTCPGMAMSAPAKTCSTKRSC